MADDLRTRALALSDELVSLRPVPRQEAGAIVDDLLAELDRVTAERDNWANLARNTSAIAVRHKIDYGDEIERLRDLAAALADEDGRGLAHKVRNEIIASAAPYWALDGGSPATTADEVRAEVNPVLTDIIHACSDVLGDGFYP